MDLKAAKIGRSALAAAALSTVLVCVFTVPMMLFGLYVATDDEASAPKVQAVPHPGEWTRRRLETADCSGSGGEFCTFVVMSPTPVTSRAEAESEYRDYLRREGWERVADLGGRPVFQRGRPGEETVLAVGSDDPYAYNASTYGEPARDTDIIVVASFADDGEAHRRAGGLKLITFATAITIAPTVIIALRGALARRSRTGPAAPNAESAN